MVGATGRPEGRASLDLTVLGHLVVDRFLHVPHLPERDRTVPLDGQRTALGGTAGNIARAAARTGLRVGLVSAVGGEFPREFRELLRRERIDLRGVRTLPGQLSSTCYILEDGLGGQMTLIDQGVFADGVPVRFNPSDLRRAPFAHLTTAPPGPLLELVRSLAGGPHLAVDPAQEIHYRWDGAGLRELLAHAEILFGNRAELQRARDLVGVATVRALVERVPLVVATLGPGGAVAYDRTGATRVAAVRPARLVQVTGAGDAFRGGFYAGWCGGLDLRTTLQGGVRSAARWIAGGGSLGRNSGRRRGRSAS